MQLIWGEVTQKMNSKTCVIPSFLVTGLNFYFIGKAPLHTIRMRALPILKTNDIRENENTFSVTMNLK
jgi:hypothetical protein